MKSRALPSLPPKIVLAAICCLVAPGICDFRECGPWVLTVGPAYAIQSVDEISVRSDVAVNDKRLTLLDFCDSDAIPADWKTLLAEVDLGPAPEPGREMSINPQQLAYRLQRFISAQGMDPDETDIQLPERITVVRRQIQMTREQIEAIYQEFILKNLPGKTPEDLVVRLNSLPSLPALPVGEMSYRVTASPNEDFLGDVGVTIHFSVDGEEIRNMRASGTVELYQDVVHSVRPMKRNEVIAESDIQLVRTNIAMHPDRYVAQRELVIGKKLLTNIGPHQPINLRNLEKPSLIKRGDPVTIIYQEEGIRLNARGEAKEDGAQGDRIRIKNIDSKKSILCRVVDSQTVEVLP